MRYSAFVTFDSRPTTFHTISIPSSDSNILPPPHQQQQIAPYHLHTVVLPPSASNTPHFTPLSACLQRSQCTINSRGGQCIPCFKAVVSSTESLYSSSPFTFQLYLLLSGVQSSPIQAPFHLNISLSFFHVRTLLQSMNI